MTDERDETIIRKAINARCPNFPGMTYSEIHRLVFRDDGALREAGSEDTSRYLMAMAYRLNADLQYVENSLGSLLNSGLEGDDVLEQIEAILDRDLIVI